MKQDTDERRLTEQLWRSYKLKYTVLAATLVGLWLLFSAVRTGQQAAKLVDRKSVDARLEFNQNLQKLVPLMGPGHLTEGQIANLQSIAKDPGQAAMMDEMEFEVYGVLLNTLGTDDQSQKGRQILQARYDQLKELITEREDAYNLEFGFSSVKNSVALNALRVIDLWPVLLISSIALIAGISLRQYAIEVILSSSIQHSATEGEMAAKSAAAGFVVGRLTPHVYRDEAVCIYKRPLMLAPEPFITMCLLGLILYLSLIIPSSEVPGHNATNSTILGYHTALLIWSVLLCILLGMTWAYYKEQVIAVTSMKVFTPWSVWLWNTFAPKSVPGDVVDSTSDRMFMIATGIGACMSLGFPWLGNQKWNIRGYELFLWQKPLSKTGDFALYKIDPKIAMEMRLQVAIAIAVVIWSILTFAWPKAKLWIRGRVVLLYACWTVIGLAANFTIYLALLRYRLEQQLLPAILGMAFSNGKLGGDRGLPLVLYSPRYGFGIFFACLVTICLAVVSSTAIRKDYVDR